MNKTTIICTCLLVLSITGCYNDKEDLLYPSAANGDCSSISATFSVDIQNIMQNKCSTSGCHDAATGAGGSVLITHAQISGAANRINQRCIIDKTMPPAAPLTATEVAALKCWIASGTPNN